jgi:hypothetical protein
MPERSGHASEAGSHGLGAKSPRKTTTDMSFLLCFVSKSIATGTAERRLDVPTSPPLLRSEMIPADVQHRRNLHSNFDVNERAFDETIDLA